MTFLYVVSHGAKISKTHDRIRVADREGKTLTEIEAHAVDGVLMLSTVQVTTQALVKMLQLGITFSILSGKGNFLGMLAPPLGKNIQLRKAQYEKENDREFLLSLSKSILHAKVSNGRATLQRYRLDEGGKLPVISQAEEAMHASMARIQEAQEPLELLGIEGNAAKHYWKAFGTMFKVEGVKFDFRLKHPSPDPVNALLSFGYALLTASIHSVLSGLGFDPFMGFLHVESYGRPSLALDLIEPFRAPIVDRFVRRQFNLRIIKHSDFEQDESGGVRLKEPALKVFFREWEQQLSRMKVRLEIRKQAEGLRRLFLGKQNELNPWKWSAR